MSFGGDDTLDPRNVTDPTFSESWGKISVAGLVAVRAIVAERVKQDELKAQGRFLYTCADISVVYGGAGGPTNAEKAAILTEEVGEVCRALLSLEGLSKNDGKQNLRKELVQVAAIALAWLEAL